MASIIHRKRGSASYIVPEVRLERERERDREREREKERERVREREKVGDEVTLPLPKIRTWRWVYTFPCQKLALFVSSFTLPISPFLNGQHCGAEIRMQWILTFCCQKISPSLFRLSQVARLFFPSNKWIKLIPKTIGNRKRDGAWGCARG